MWYPNVTTGMQWIREILANASASNAPADIAVAAAIRKDIVELTVPVAFPYLGAAITWADDDSK